MAFTRVYFKHMPQRELKIFLAVLSCWAIRQWGSYTGTNRYATYPIAFAKMNQLVAIATGCNIDIDTCDLTWFAFHIRQPGEAAVDTLTSTTIHWISVGY